jgi:hypothetical protein
LVFKDQHQDAHRTAKYGKCLGIQQGRSGPSMAERVNEGGGAGTGPIRGTFLLLDLLSRYKGSLSPSSLTSFHRENQATVCIS